MRKTCSWLLAGIMALQMVSCGGPSSDEIAEKYLLDAKTFFNLRFERTDDQTIDVRTPEEYAEGHLIDAKNMNVNGDSFAQQIQTLDKGRPVMVYCQAGGRSAQAAAQLREAGFKEVYDLKGGMLAWKKGKFPTSNPPVEDFFQEDLDRLLSEHEYVVIDFYAHWCGPCRRIDPILEQVSKEFEGKVHYEKINVDYISAELADALGIDEIPIVAAFKNGKELKRLIGDEHSKETFRNLFRLK